MPGNEQDRPRLHAFSRRVVLTLGIISVYLLLLLVAAWASHVLLVIFGGMLTATFVRSLTVPLRERTGLPHALLVVLVILGLFGLSYLAGLYLAPHVAVQVNELEQRMPAAIDSVQQRIRQSAFGNELISQLPDLADLAKSQRVLQEVRGLFSVTLGVFADLFIYFFTTIYLLFDPDVYVNGFLRLVPLRRRKRVRELFDAIAATLRKWLLGTLVSMAATGVITGVGLWLLGIPLALTLGLLAGFLTFVPYIGGILSAIPAVLLALLDRPMLALSVVGIYLLAHTVEAYIVTPLVQQRQVHLPPVLTLIAQVILGSAAGVLGLMMATPFTAMLVVMVKMLYVEDVLGEREAERR